MSGFVSGQEVILSQPFSVTQYQNPSGVGGGAYDHRFQSNYKNQLVDNNANLFRTFLFAYDTRLKYDLEESKNYFGLGIQYIDDEVMQGIMKNNYVNLNGAYHIFLDRNLISHLSLGIGVTYAFTSLDRSKLRFNDQYDYRGILTMPSLENLKPYPNNVTTNVGLMFTRHSETSFLQAGFMTYLYDKPNVTYSPINKAGELRYRAFVNSEAAISDYNSMLFYLSYNNNTLSNQIIAGSMIGLKVIKDEYDLNKLYIGCFYRYKEAFVPTIAFIKNRFTYGFSYDVYSNNLTLSDIKMNTLEFTFSSKLGQIRKETRYRTIFD